METFIEVDVDQSYLRKFESIVAAEFGKEDSVFMPSGVMAQGIALLIHMSSSSSSSSALSSSSPNQLHHQRNEEQAASAAKRRIFACHHTSHLLLHENDAFRELLQMEALAISTKDKLLDNGYSVPPLTYCDVKDALEIQVDQEDGEAEEGTTNTTSETQRIPSRGKKQKQGDLVSTLILELPHREIGGKCTPWDDILQLRTLCNDLGIKMHCDGARIFESTTGYNDRNDDDVGDMASSLKDLVAPFDSVYISFYKGLGGLSGAMLLGDNDFCREARTWLRRFGGNLYTILPYVVSGWVGYKQCWADVGMVNDIGDDVARKYRPSASFKDKKTKLRRLVALLRNDPQIQKILSFDPEVPEVNMVHGYLKVTKEEFEQANKLVEERMGIRVLNRLRDLEHDDERCGAHRMGFRSMFEWSLGEGNYYIDDAKFLDSWRLLTNHLFSSQSHGN